MTAIAALVPLSWGLMGHELTLQSSSPPSAATNGMEKVMANRSAAQVAPILPRFIRFGEAYGYLGMCRDEFNKTVRPHVREFPIGKQGVGFDRLELDEWADAYIQAMAIEKAANQDNNRPRSERQGGSKGDTQWHKKQSPGSSKCRAASGRSTRSTEVNEFKRALALVTASKRSST